ncbi:hypothetical protein EDB80DRAFT_765021 [Ilyonectria destructans]|nr:hypothetical protein EDB80DRAFT_765021 [Ilyonectria destructans]
MDKFDCVVVGAGWYGLAAVKQYYCTCPEDSLVVFELEAMLGGIWADYCLYPGLKSNNLLGTYKYPNFPMDSATFNIKLGEYIPGGVINVYLKAYAAKFGINDLVCVEIKGGWVLMVAGSKKEETKVCARRLIIATSLILGKSVIVFGGIKFAWDAVYVYITAGVKVNWVIRSSGYGPCWMVPAYVMLLKKWLEKLANIWFLTWFSPCIWGGVDGYGGIYSFLYSTAVGRAIVNGFWSILDGDVVALNKYDSHPNTAKLKPWIEVMFAGTSFSILNYNTDFLELVKGDMVNIHIGEIDHLSPGKVHLSDSTEFKSDALLANTGWKYIPPMKFLPEGIEKELGLPYVPEEGAPEEDLTNQHPLIKKADHEIMQCFLCLKYQPIWNKNYVSLTDQKGISSSDDVMLYKSLTLYMLYHFLVPPSERLLRTRDIAFIGMVSNFSNIITAYLQGLWISAYFLGRLRDLGLEPHRKGGFWSEIWDLYGPEDYWGINEDWKAKYGSDKPID